uniref:Receptor expression-enhancing protein n=1 Tax=Panagrellus redivivus TaxID=6233 RepID=A0A7E4VPJ4_PANRE
MPLPPQVEKLVADFDKILHQPGQITNVLAQIEEKTKVKRLHLAGGLIVLHALYLVFGRFAELLCNVTGFLYPAYISIKAIESATKEDDTQWLTYWVVFALFNVIEFFSDVITRYFPIYWLAKWAFLLYLHLPITRGAETLYARFIRPFVLKHQSGIDQAIGKAKEGLSDAKAAFNENVKTN